LKELEDFVRADLREGNDQNQAIYQASLTAVGNALDDKIAQINQRGMSLLQTTLTCADYLNLEPENAQSLLFSTLINRLGDNNPRVREKAEELLLGMSTNSGFGPEKIVQSLIKQAI
jgi:hypothetical protein